MQDGRGAAPRPSPFAAAIAATTLTTAFAAAAVAAALASTAVAAAPLAAAPLAAAALAASAVAASAVAAAPATKLATDSKFTTASTARATSVPVGHWCDRLNIVWLFVRGRPSRLPGARRANPERHLRIQPGRLVPR